MKAALIGYGKMGRLLEQRLLEKKHQVIAIVDPFYKGTGDDIPSKAAVYASLENALKGAGGKSLKDADVVIEFTSQCCHGKSSFSCQRKNPHSYRNHRLV